MNDRRVLPQQIVSWALGNRTNRRDPNPYTTANIKQTRVAMELFMLSLRGAEDVRLRRAEERVGLGAQTPL
jgi:hypothetical protein